MTLPMRTVTIDADGVLHDPDSGREVGRGYLWKKVVPTPYGSLLQRLLTVPGEFTYRDAAAYLHLLPQNASSMLAYMARQGYVRVVRPGRHCRAAVYTVPQSAAPVPVS